MRNMWTIVLMTVGAAVILSLPIHGRQSAPAPRDISPRLLDVQGGKIRVTTVATGLFHPWSMAFIDTHLIIPPIGDKIVCNHVVGSLPPRVDGTSRSFNHFVGCSSLQFQIFFYMHHNT